MDKKIIIGFGTGRCGTKSLAAFLNQQKGWEITHEEANMSWYPALTDSKVCIDRFISKRNGSVIGDIGFYWINYLNLILRKYSGSKAINIRRPIDEVIESFWSYRNDETDGNIGTMYWFGYPFDAPTKTKDDIAFTVKRYQFLEFEVQKIYPSSIYIMPIDDLNSKNKLESLLEWIEEDNIYNLNQFHINRRDQVIKQNKTRSKPFESVLNRKDVLL